MAASSTASESSHCRTSRRGEVHHPGEKRAALASRMLGNGFGSRWPLDSFAAALVATPVFEGEAPAPRPQEGVRPAEVPLGEGTLAWLLLGAESRVTSHSGGSGPPSHLPLLCFPRMHSQLESQSFCFPWDESTGERMGYKVWTPADATRWIWVSHPKSSTGSNPTFPWTGAGVLLTADSADFLSRNCASMGDDAQHRILTDPQDSVQGQVREGVRRLLCPGRHKLAELSQHLSSLGPVKVSPGLALQHASSLCSGLLPSP